MSPVSRGRKSKKQKKAQNARQRATKIAARGGAAGQASAEGLAALRDLLYSPRERPEWFDPSIASVLREAGATMTAAGPRELEQVAAELTGAEIHRALRDHTSGMWFDWWFEELALSAGERVKAGADADGGEWRAPWRLLHGLAAIGTPALRSTSIAAAEDALGVLGPERAAAEPAWLSLCQNGTVTGGLWTMRDDYQTRFAVLTECGYPDGAGASVADPHVLMFDIDACGIVSLAGAAIFDSVEQAAQAWRLSKGDAAGSGQPVPVTEYAQLACLFHCDLSPSGILRGDEPRGFTDNLFRASRRIHDVVQAMEKLGRQWAAPRNLYRDRDGEIEAAVKEFGGWYAERHGRDPHQEAVQWLAGDWLEGTLPDCGNAVSPHRVHAQKAYMDDDWRSDEPATAAAYELLPEWVRWNGERAGIPRPLIERSAKVADGEPWNSAECPAFTF